MGKRSNFKRRPQDAYDTPPEALIPLLPHLPQRPFSFWEPCAGKGDLAQALHRLTGARHYASDIMPRSEHVVQMDALDADAAEVSGFDKFITNPPWTRQILHPMIDRFRAIRPTWLLFDADWMHTKQAEPYLPYCHKIVSVGRVKWIPDSAHTGKDNCAWYLFQNDPAAQTAFIGRSA